MTTPTDGDRIVSDDELRAADEAFIKAIRKDFQEKLAPMSREERRKWLKRMSIRLLGDLATFETDPRSADEGNQG